MSPVKSTLVKMRVGAKHYEILVDLELALKLRKGDAVAIQNVLLVNDIFTNHKTGTKASSEDLTAAFGSADVFAVADRMVKKGDIQLPQDYREEQQDNKKKQVIDWLVRNAVDARTGRPFTPQVITSALSQAGVNITNLPVDQQVSAITEGLKSILPIKIETKKIAITIPAIYTGKAYGLLNQYKEKEDWLSDGSLKVTINLPIGLQMEFYDKLNAITHGAALSEEIKVAAK
ncbi:MAG: ribosome assembly factor SBDS [Nanoarchaeota archaeon]